MGVSVIQEQETKKNRKLNNNKKKNLMIEIENRHQVV